MARGLFILNDAPYGTARSYNGVQLAGALETWFEGHSRPDMIRLSAS